MTQKITTCSINYRANDKLKYSTRRAEAEAYPRSNKTEHAAQSYTARKTNKISMLRNPLEMLLLLLRNTIVEVKALLD